MTYRCRGPVVVSVLATLFFSSLAGIAWAAEDGTNLAQVNIASQNELTHAFHDPPSSARPSIYWLSLNGYLVGDHIERELRQLNEAGISGLCIFDMGARGAPEAMPPAGPAFLDDTSVKAIAGAIGAASRLDMETQLSVSSSWDMGGSWVKPRHASMGLYRAEIEVEGPSSLDRILPFPTVPAKAPRGADGRPVFHQNVAILAIPLGRRLSGHEFVFELDPPGLHTLDHVVLYNTDSGDTDRYGEKQLFAKDFSVAVSTAPPEEGSFRQILSASLQATTEAQRFDLPPAGAKYVRLCIHNGHNTAFPRVQLGEFEVYSQQAINVVASHVADRSRDGAQLVNFASALGQNQQWTADNLNDGVKSGPTGSWSSAGPPPPLVEDVDSVIDLTDRIGEDGRLQWDVPPGQWVIQRFVCLNTGERLKVPSPNSDGLATDHLSRDATEQFMTHVIDRLRSELGDLRDTALKRLYLASYEVRGPIWTPDFLTQFRRRRGYDMTRYLPALSGAVVGTRERTHRFRYDFRKTLGDVLVDQYYRAARDTAHRAGLGIEAEAGGPGPPIHQVPVDSLKALGSVDAMRGEFWPKRPNADSMWVVKETACAAHIYGHRRVHMEAFTSMHHWQDSPQDLKASADRAFCEGANHFVWHTSSHLPPEAGKPGWVYGAGTHLNTNLIWWPKAKPFLDYLARCSFLLQQGRFVGDVCYYYGDQGYNFVRAKHIDPSLGPGYDYDVVNAEVILTRMSVRDNRLILPDGMSYRLMVLPDRDDIDLQVLQQIEKLVDAGATIVGRKPTRTNGLTDFPQRDDHVRQLADKLWGQCDGQTVKEHAYGKGRVVWGITQRQLLRQCGYGPDFSFDRAQTGTDLDFIHRRTDTTDIYFVQNKRDQWEQVDAEFRVHNKAPELWLPETGETRKQFIYELTDNGVRMPLRLAPHGSVFVVFRAPADGFRLREIAGEQEPASSARENEVQPWSGAQVVDCGQSHLRVMAFENGTYTFETPDRRTARVHEHRLPPTKEVFGPWQVRFPPDRGAPDSVVLGQLDSWTVHPNDGVKYFSGIARYQRPLDIPADWLGKGRRVFLDLGQLWAIGEVYLNGQSLGVVWKAPFCVDLTPAALPGVNQLEIEIANTWSNRLAGDARLGAGPRYGRTNVLSTGGKPWATTPLLPSGLLGPVRLVPAAITTAKLR